MIPTGHDGGRGWYCYGPDGDELRVHGGWAYDQRDDAVDGLVGHHRYHRAYPDGHPPIPMTGNPVVPLDTGSGRE